MNNQGTKYEALAATWLAERAVKIIVKNYLCKAGEIDLIALDGDYLVFVEVRSRGNPRFSSAAASVDRRKQLKLIRTAQFFLQRNPKWGKIPCRFDVIAFEPRQSKDEIAVNWIRAAFTQ